MNKEMLIIADMKYLLLFPIKFLRKPNKLKIIPETLGKMENIIKSE